MQKQISIKFGQPGSMEYILRSQLAKSAGGLVKMAPGTAKRILEELNFPGQRDIRSSRVYSKHLLLVTGDWMESYPIDFGTVNPFCPICGKFAKEDEKPLIYESKK